MIRSNQKIINGAAIAILQAAPMEDSNPTRSSELKLTLKELAKAGEVSERTIRYYIQQGVLPPPQGAGPASCYGLEHLTRLSLVRRLKAALLPLSRIKELLTDVGLAELDQVADQLYRDLAHTNPVLEDKHRGRSRLSSRAGMVDRSKASSELAELEVFYPPSEAEVQTGLVSGEVLNRSGSSKESFKEGLKFRGRWNRIVLAPGLELHYEENGPQDSGKAREKLAQLVEMALSLYE